MIVIGIDPSSQDKGHGVAVYDNGVLIELHMMKTIDIVLSLFEKYGKDAVYSIENVCANNFVYGRNENSKDSKDVHGEKKRILGMCQQSQIELTRWLERFGINYVLHDPTRKNWHKNKKLFESATGWNRQSNDDTRSAAYFGYLEVKNPIFITK